MCDIYKYGIENNYKKNGRLFGRMKQIAYICRQKITKTNNYEDDN